MNPIAVLRKKVEMNPINKLRRLGLIETLAFRLSYDSNSWNFKETHGYYAEMTTRSHWRSL